MKGIPTPLCQIAIPSALSNARVWVKGRLCWTCTTLLSQGEARRFETTEDSGTMGGIPCFLWGGGRGDTSSVTNEGKCRFVFYFINARAFARPSTSLIRMNEWMNECEANEVTDLPSLEIRSCIFAIVKFCLVLYTNKSILIRNDFIEICSKGSIFYRSSKYIF